MIPNTPRPTSAFDEFLCSLLCRLLATGLEEHFAGVAHLRNHVQIFAVTEHVLGRPVWQR